MTLHQDLNKEIIKIKKQAKNHQGNIQKLMDNLELAMGTFSQDGYSMTLVEATENTEITLDKGMTEMTGHEDVPYTKVINLQIEKDLLAPKLKKLWKAKIPKGYQFAICRTTLNQKKSSLHHNVFDYQLRKVTYQDILNLIKRFYTIKKFMEKYDDMGAELDLDSIFEILRHAVRIAQHGFIKEALQVIYNSKIAPDARQTINKNLFFIKPNHHIMHLVPINSKYAYKTHDLMAKQYYKTNATHIKKCVDAAINALKDQLKAREESDFYD